MKDRLTHRERDVLDAIRALTSETGIPPTVLEIAERLRYAKSSVSEHIHALTMKGCVTSDAGKMRSVRVVGDPEPLHLSLPEDVLHVVWVHAQRLTDGNVAEMASRIVAGWAACQSERS